MAVTRNRRVSKDGASLCRWGTVRCTGVRRLDLMESTQACVHLYWHVNMSQASFSVADRARYPAPDLLDGESIY